MDAAASSTEQAEEHPWLACGHAPFAGKYTVERILGQGGMGVVFEARHVRLGQRVAIKVLGSALREYPELVERFEREARAAGSLTSTHAVRVFDIDVTDDGTPFIVMELLAGRDLGAIVERDGPQPVTHAVRWLIEACDAIAEAHRLGIIHRDLKPSNLFLTDVDGRQLVKVLDFGIAKRVSTQETQITQAVAPLGTPQYMSPEQVRCAKDVDSRTDVWSLGITLYEMVCGQTPFAHESASACIASIAADPVADPRTLRPDLPEAFAAVLMKALAKNANDRYQTVAELVTAIAPFALEDDEDDEELVSAVRRAYTPAEYLVTAPAISLALIAPKRSKTRSGIAMATAVMLGLAALVVTPRCVTTNDDAAHAIHVASRAAPVAAPLPAVALPAAPGQAAAAAREVEAEPKPVAVVAPVSAPFPSPPATPAARVAVAMGSSALDAKQFLPHRTEKTASAHSSVHGGLSSPGF